jgi:hypothetical protein
MPMHLLVPHLVVKAISRPPARPSRRDDIDPLEQR